jgi:hypothetical protein
MDTTPSEYQKTYLRALHLVEAGAVRPSGQYGHQLVQRSQRHLGQTLLQTSILTDAEVPDAQVAGCFEQGVLMRGGDADLIQGGGLTRGALGGDEEPAGALVKPLL